MQNTEEVLKKAWENIEYFKGGSRRVGVEHILEWHVACMTPTNKALIIVAQQPIRNIESSKSIDTVCNKRSDGRYYIAFQLTEKAQEDVFINMCSDLIDYSSSALTESSALRKIELRYKQWQRLMENRNSAVLSDEKRRGLIGELLFLRSMLGTGRSGTDVLAGWVGPDGNDQDFVYDGMWHEIKTTRQASDAIEISSLEQLGNSSATGELRIYRVDPCAPETNEAFSLCSLVRDIEELFSGDPDSRSMLTDKLNKVGYIDMEIYEKFTYKCSSFGSYEVDSAFPRLTRTAVRTEIIKCRYFISISSISRWKRG